MWQRKKTTQPTEKPMWFKANFRTSFKKTYQLRSISEQDLATTINHAKNKGGLVRYHNACHYANTRTKYIISDALNQRVQWLEREFYSLCSWQQENKVYLTIWRWRQEHFFSQESYQRDHSSQVNLQIFLKNIITASAWKALGPQPGNLRKRGGQMDTKE